ncbi:MAG: hypothetical protein ACI9OO_000744, partial [Bacteroidia bacterium]
NILGGFAPCELASGALYTYFIGQAYQALYRS